MENKMENKLDQPIEIDIAFGRLRQELCLRENNTSTSFSGLGGNVKQFLWLLLSDAECKSDSVYIEELVGACTKVNNKDGSTEELIDTLKLSNSEPIFCFSNNKLYLKCYPGYHACTVLQLREKLNQFIADNNIVLPDVLETQVTDVSYMSQYKGRSFYMDLYLKCLNDCYQLKELLISKEPLRKTINQKFSKEKENLVSLYAKDNNLSLNLKNDYYNVISIIKKSKIHFVKWNDICAREEKENASLLEDENIKSILDFINSVPVYITIIPLRIIVSLELMIKFNLDKHLSSLRDAFC